MYFFIFILLFSKVAKTCNNSFDCKYLPNGCKFEKSLNEYPLLDTIGNINAYSNEVFICNSLDKSFNFSQQEMDKCKKYNSSNTKVYYKLSSPEILDSSFRASEAQEFVSKMMLKRTNCRSELSFKNLKGFDINSSFYLDLPIFSTCLLSLSSFIIYESKFEFYFNQRKIKTCKDFLMTNLTESKSLFQIKSNNFKIQVELRYVKFSNPICPILLRDINVYQLIITYMVNTFYKKSILQFTDDYNDTHLNSKINQLLVYRAEKIDIDSKFLNKNIYQDSVTIIFGGEINSIQDDLFRPFRKLIQISFDIEFFEQLIHKGTKWISSINYDLRVNVSNKAQLDQYIKRTVRLKLSFYQGNRNMLAKVILFRNEDFCLFKDFPFEQLIVFNVAFQNNITKIHNVSCTFLWLSRDFDSYAQYSFLKKSFHDTFSDDFSSINKSEVIKTCDFDKRLRLCQNLKLDHNSLWTLNDTRRAMFMTEFIIMILLIALNVLGIVTNVLVVLTVSLKDSQEYVQEKHYSYMRIVSITNVLVLLISLLSPIYECDTLEGIYCSILNEYIYLQYFRIIFGEFLSSMLKLFSNFAYVGFCICRLYLIGKNHAKFVKWIANLSLIKFLAASLFFSVALSVVKIFRYQVNSFDANLDYPIPYDRNPTNMFSYGFATKSRVINVFNAISDLTNYFVFFLVNLILDIVLVVKLKRTLSEKINGNKIENEQVVIKVIGSVISFAMFSLLLKLPASIKSVFDSVHLDNFYNATFTTKYLDYIYEKFCVYARECPAFEKLGNLLFNISLSINIAFYYVFDKKFKIGLCIAISKLLDSKEKHAEYLRVLNNSEKLRKSCIKKRRIN